MAGRHLGVACVVAYMAAGWVRWCGGRCLGDAEGSSSRSEPRPVTAGRSLAAAPVTPARVAGRGGSASRRRDLPRAARACCWTRRDRAGGVSRLRSSRQPRHRLLGVGAGVGVPGLGAKLEVERLADHVEDRLLGRAHRRAGSCAGSGGRPSRLRRARSSWGTTFVDQAALERLAARRRLGGEQHVRGDVEAAGVDQPHDAAVAVVKAAAGLEGAEHRPLGGDPDVAGERGLEPAGERPAVDAAMIGFAIRCMPRVNPLRPELDDLADVMRPRSCDHRRDVGLQVGAGAEARRRPR